MSGIMQVPVLQLPIQQVSVSKAVNFYSFKFQHLIVSATTNSTILFLKLSISTDTYSIVTCFYTQLKKGAASKSTSNQQ